MKTIPEMRIAFASDHALKQTVKQMLQNKGAEVFDFGCYSTDSCDYPDYAHPCAEAVEKGQYDYGVVICSTGNGITMTANKHPHIRAALCWEPRLAQLARQHNNANILGLPANFISEAVAEDVVRTFFTTEFEGGRHQRRIDKIPMA